MHKMNARLICLTLTLYMSCDLPEKYSFIASIYFTVTLHFTVTFPDFTVMVLFPRFKALIFPFLSTSATFLFEEVYVTASSLFDGYSFVFNIYYLPIFSYNFGFTTVIFVVIVFGTAIVTV